MGAYYNDPSGLGSWYVPDGQTPAQALADIKAETGQTFSPLLEYSARNTPAAQKPFSRDTATQVGSGYNLSTPSPSKPNAFPAIHPKVVFTGGPVSASPGDSLPICGPGAVYDDFNDECYFVDGTVGVQGTGTGGVNVTVTNTLTLAAGVGQAIANTVSTAIQDAVDQAKAAAADAANAVEAGIQQTIDAVTNATTGLFDTLKRGLDYVYNLIKDNIGSLINFVVNHIGELISTVKDVIQNVIIPLAKQINDVINKVNDVISNTIAPIFDTISKVYRETQALIQAIQQDVAAGIAGILQIPNDITAAITSVEGQLGRVLNQIGLKTKDDVSVFTSADGRDSIWSRLDHIGKGVASIGGVDNAKITYSDFVKLSEPDLSRAGAKSIDALTSEIGAFIRDLISGTTRSLDAAKTTITTAPLLLGVEAGTWIGLWELIRSLDQLFEPFYKFAKEDLAAKAGLSKLPTGQVLEAYRRGIVNDNDLAEDLAVNGWDEGRISVLKDLQEYLVDISMSIDMWHRGIIKEDELNNSLRKHGVSGDQMAALKEQSVLLFDPNLAALALRWQIITEKEYDAVMRENRFTDAEITVRKVTMFQRERVDDVIARKRREVLFSGVGYVPSGYSDPDKDTLAAAARDGLDATSALDRWQSSFFIPSLSEWIIGNFRHLYDARELHAAMDYYRVPEQWRDAIVHTHRALIPFRTIPTMLANGIIDEAYAKQQLEAHGFDLVATEALLKYAEVAHKKQKSAASGDVFGLSVAVAKGYFDSGTITDEQYKQVLLAHGYDEQSANFTVHIEQQHAAMLERKQLASDLVAEVKSGVMSLDQAQAMMDAHQFSVAEKSHVLNNINRMKRQNAKVPSESELHSMASKNVISVDMYRSGMEANGWTEPWITYFVNWRFPNAALVQATQ
jgi:hypothetical protein